MNPRHLPQIICSCNKIVALANDFRGLFSKIVINVIKFNQKQLQLHSYNYSYTATSYVNVIYTYVNA
jgi:hypothetical protein